MLLHFSHLQLFHFIALSLVISFHCIVIQHSVASLLVELSEKNTFQRKGDRISPLHVGFAPAELYLETYTKRCRVSCKPVREKGTRKFGGEGQRAKIWWPQSAHVDLGLMCLQSVSFQPVKYGILFPPSTFQPTRNSKSRN